MIRKFKQMELLELKNSTDMSCGLTENYSTLITAREKTGYI